MNLYGYLDEGFRVFGLLANTDYDGSELPDKQKYKKPRVSSWQHTPHWSDDQLEVMEEAGYFSTGFGVIVKGWLVIDIDPRNGGTVEQVQQWYDQAGFVVATGGGGWHIYYKLPEGDKSAYVQHLNDYDGIDWKTTGFVIGASSLHASGSTYDVEKGSPDKITEAPQELLNLLKKPERYRVSVDGGHADVSQEQVEAMLSYVDPDCDYDTWIKCGMVLHHVLNGCGIDVWDEWSKQGKKYTGYEAVERHWHSFGKSATPVSFGTLKHFAEEAGYQEAVTFDSDLEFDDTPTVEVNDPLSVDLLRPPGFVGELTEWFNSQSFFPRERLAVAAALTAVGSIAGMRYVDSSDMTANLFSLCISGSGTGKESIQQSYAECIRAANMGGAMHGSIKSEQEIMRNMISNQASFYCLDEFGYLLKKLSNAAKSGASYLEGVVSLLMSAYTKADSYLPLGGDLKKEMAELLKRDIAECNKAIDNNEDKFGNAKRRLDASLEMMKELKKGIRRPFINLIGFATPVTFDSSVSFEMATNGFIARSFLVVEPETNPRKNKKRAKKGMPTNLQMQIAALANNGEFADVERVDFAGEQTTIPDTDEADKLLEEVYEHFWQKAEEAKSSGLEPIPRRSYELVAKVSLILAIPSGLRTAEHVKWAFELIKRDCDAKMRLARSNDVQKDDPKEAIAIRIQSILNESDDGETQGVIVNRCRPHKKNDVIAVLEALTKNGFIIKSEGVNKFNKRPYTRYRIK